MNNRDRLEEALRDAEPTAPKGTWLIVLPASGKAFRMNGRLIVLDMGEDVGRTPFIFTDGKAIAVDARALILNNTTLVPLWQPCENLDHLHPGLRAWFKTNPAVFRPDTPSGITRI